MVSRPRSLTMGLGLVSITTCLAATIPAFSEEQDCPETDTGVSLPSGFCATIFADKVGHARQLAVAPDGTVYVNTWSGVYYGNDKPHDGGFLIALKDTKGTGHADVNVRFGPTFAEGAHGGTGIWLYKNSLYAEIDDKIVRYLLKDGEAAPTGKAETILSGMPDHRRPPDAWLRHRRATAICSWKWGRRRTPARRRTACRTPPASILAPSSKRAVESGATTPTRAIRYSRRRNAMRPATATPRASTSTQIGRLYITQHGRDQLHEDWPELYTAKQGCELPSEEVTILKQGANYGWPYCYYDPEQKKLVLAPEYGGDGGKKVGRCDTLDGPVAAFPAHWAPNDLKIYKGSQFPKVYQGGAFIAFHGSWNRAPGPQGGYNVVFQPLADGKTSGDYVVFADGFAGPKKEPGGAVHRPSGLAVGPDGALYITDDKAGRIWRVTYNGDPNAPIEAAPAPTKQAEASPGALPPEGMHPDAGLPVPPGATARAGRARQENLPRRGCRCEHAPDVMVPTASARRSAPTFRAAHGCGGTEAFRASPISSKTACQSPNNIRARCRRLAVSPCQTPTSPL